MKRNDFAANKVGDKESKPNARAKNRVAESNAKVGASSKLDGKGLNGKDRSLIPNSFIEKMDSYIPDKKRK